MISTLLAAITYWRQPLLPHGGGNPDGRVKKWHDDRKHLGPVSRFDSLGPEISDECDKQHSLTMTVSSSSEDCAQARGPIASMEHRS